MLYFSVQVSEDGSQTADSETGLSSSIAALCFLFSGICLPTPET
jgi:hypothetical protein